MCTVELTTTTEESGDEDDPTQPGGGSVRFPKQGVRRVGRDRWTGREIRTWADKLAKQVEAGEVEVSVDLDLWAKNARTWKLSVVNQ